MSKREDLEIRIKEQRVLEANKKGLIGSSGKLGTILKALGHEIVSHEMEFGLPDPWDLDAEEEPRDSKELMSRLPTMDIEGNQRPSTEEWGDAGDSAPCSTRKIGMHFDGLSRGMHMEIMYDDEKSELSVTHKGYTVYKEVMGDIEMYIPGEEWEGWVERLWGVAKEIQRKKKESEFKAKAEEADKAKGEWLSSLFRRWGRI